MTSAETLRRLSEELPALRRRFGVETLAIFGSVARDDAGPDSDLDVLVTFVGRPTFDGYMGLKLRLEELFARQVDLAIHSDLRPALRSLIESETLYVA